MSASQKRFSFTILAAFGVLLIAMAVFEIQNEDPLAEIFDLKGVPVSVELVDHLAAGRISLSGPDDWK